MPSLRLSFYIGAILTVIAAILSAMRGETYVHDIHSKQAVEVATDGGSEKRKKEN